MEKQKNIEKLSEEIETGASDVSFAGGESEFDGAARVATCVDPACSDTHDMRGRSEEDSEQVAVRDESASSEQKKSETDDESNDSAETAQDAEGDQAQEQDKPSNVDKDKKNSDKTKKKLPKWLRRLIKLLIKITILAAVGFALWHWVGNVYITHDNNMYPHIKDGDLVVTYKLKGYYNNDTVLYETKNGMKVGRIIAHEGDTVQIQNDGLFTVNGSIPYENVYYSTLPAEESSVEYPYEVQEGEYFILNDMREMTNDSRVVGSIPEENLCGTVQIVVRHRGM